MHRLDHEPAREEDLAVFVQYPAVQNGKKIAGMVTQVQIPAVVFRRAGQVNARIDYGPTVDELTELGVKRTWPITVVLEYPVRSEIVGRRPAPVAPEPTEAPATEGSAVPPSS